MKAYISGGMTNIPEFNFPEFDDVTHAWRALGHEAVSPAEHDREVVARTCVCATDLGPVAKPEHFPGYAEGNVPLWSEATGFKYETAMAWDINAVIECDAIVMLPGWERSSGARTERFVAEVTGKKVYLARRFGDMWTFPLDPIQKRMALTVMPAFDAAAAKAY